MGFSVRFAGGRIRLVSSACWRASRGLSTRENLSIRSGPTEPALYTGTIPQHFAATVSKYGDRPAVIVRAPVHFCPSASSSSSSPPAQETTLTYHALDLTSNRLASSLKSLGVRRGDRVAVCLGNDAEFAALTYALYKLGAILVPLNPGFTADQVRAALRHLAVEVLIIGAVSDLSYKPARGRSNAPLLETLLGGDLRASTTSSGKGSIRSEVVPSLRHVVVVDNRAHHHSSVTENFTLDECHALIRYEDLLGQGSERPVKPDESLHADDTINIQFTSGTTSTPKAAMLTHSSILNNGALIAHRMGLVPEDRIVVPPPLFHCFGSVLGYMATATTGAALLFPSPAFDPVAAVRMCTEHDATGLYGVSTMIVSVLDALDRPGVLPEGSPGPRHLRKGIVAGSSVPESLMRRVRSRLGLEDLVICYGMTETSPVSCMTTPSDPLAKRVGSVGRPMPHTTVKIVDPTDRSRIVPIGERGELAAAGYLVMKGYYSDRQRTAEVRIAEPDPHGGGPGATTVWMYSGDEASMDADGYVSITGRIKDLIIRGGENIHPLEVEDCLFQMSGVQEVSVVGVPDERLGESVAAFIIPARGWSVEGEEGKQDVDKTLTRDVDKTLTRDAVREWVRSRLSSHLVPKHVFWADELPKTASGKIQKYKLRDTAASSLKAA